MKKLFLLLIVVAVFAGCSKDEVVEPIDTINLKDWVMTADLFAGQHILVGSVTFIDTEDGFFEVTFNLTDGWTMSESHVYAGPIKDIPTNKPGAPKIGKFPYKETHNPAVTTYTYSFPSVSVDDQDNYALAAHCVVNHPDENEETGWASLGKTFSDKGWGSYCEDFYGEATYIDNHFYGIGQTDAGTLILSLISGGANRGDVILTEAIVANGSVEAAAYDPATGNLFFVIGNTLYVNNMGTEELTVVAGSLSGLPIGGVFLNGNYYYIDGDPNSPNYMEIIEVWVTYDPNNGWSITENPDFSGAIPYDLDIIDLATDGSIIYFIGINDNGTPNDGDDDWVDMFTFIGGVYSTPIATDLSGNAQIAFGADGLLYTIDVNEDGYNVLLYVDPGTGDTDPVNPGDDSMKDGDDNPSDTPLSDFIDGF